MERTCYRCKAELSIGQLLVNVHDADGFVDTIHAGCTSTCSCGKLVGPGGVELTAALPAGVLVRDAPAGASWTPSVAGRTTEPVLVTWHLCAECRGRLPLR